VFLVEGVTGRFEPDQVIPLLIIEHPLESPVKIVPILIRNSAGLPGETRESLLSLVESVVPASRLPNVRIRVQLTLAGRFTHSQ